MTIPGLLLIVQLAAVSQTVTGIVVDSTGAPIPGTRISSGQLVATSAADGSFAIAIGPPARLILSAPGFAEQTVDVTAASARLRVVLRPQGISETLTVTAPAGRERVSSPASVTVLDAEALATAPALTLDEQLRTVPGFSLFRRSSSRVANPTTQGVTLRGMAASGASRAAVVADGLALTDPFGGWVYWDRVPAAAIERVEVARGGASDVFGSDAMGGAIRIETSRGGVRLVAEGGADETARASVFAGRRIGAVSLRGSAEQFSTAGFIVVAPESRGAVDVNAWSRHTSVSAAAGAHGFEVRGGYFAERRGNGTPVQGNATVVRDLSARASGGLAAGFWSARAALAGQGYDQTFSAIARDRSLERLTTAQRVGVTTASVDGEWFRAWPALTLFVSGGAATSSAEIVERGYPVSFTPPPFVQDPRQRSGALAAQASWTASPRVTVAAGVRGELWSTRLEGDAASHAFGFIVPRASLAFRASPALVLRLSAHDAYRHPTMNELYRGFQVGNVFTSSNPALGPEESYGLDTSALVTRGRVTARASAFVSRVSDAIVNVTLNQDPSLIERMRDNAGTIRATGIELESEVRLARALVVTASGAYTRSSFTSGELDGLRVPQVPRFQGALGLRSAWPRASAALDWRYTSSQFDDDRNRFLLEPAAIADARIAWLPRSGLDVFVAVENLFDAEQDVGRTPLRTIGLPRTARLGVRLSLKP